MLKRHRNAVPIVLFVLSIAAAPHAQFAPPSRRVEAIKMPDSLVSQMMELGRTNRSGSSGLGIFRRAGKITQLGIVSNRIQIAFNARKAFEQGGRYTPPEDLKPDIVSVTCGDEDFTEQWNCVGLRVSTIAGDDVAPVLYEVGPQSFRNALGARWTVTIAWGRFRAADLKDGFKVAYASPDGIDFVYTVTTEEAADALFLGVANGGLAPVTGQGLPNGLRVRIDPAPEGWRVTNRDAYRWERCRAELSQGVAQIGVLDDNASALIRRTDFTPPLEAGERGTPRILCRAGITTFISTGVDR